MLSAAFASSAESWYQAKLFLEHALSISHDSIHVIAGVVLQIAAALLFRRKIASWLPWALVLLSALANEAVDLWVERWPDPAMQFGEGAKDVLLTILLPTVLLLTARVKPGILARQ